MNHPLISMYIDDELTLDDKIEFVETINESRQFTDETVGLLRQEKLLRSDTVECFPERVLAARRSPILRFLRPFGFAAAVAVTLIVLLFPFRSQRPPDTPFRFVFYRPDVSRVDITGSFTGWNAVAMRKVGDSGYWEYTFNLPRGEYRFAYLLDGGDRLPDPTIPTREADDFGSQNTVLSIGGTET